MNDKNSVKFYTKDEISNLFKSNERLVYIDDGLFETIGRYQDLPDIIVDLTLNHDVDYLKVYDYEGKFYEPILDTFGCFLNKCKKDIREDIIKRLIDLQLGLEKIKDYKLIDEYTLEEYENDLKGDDFYGRDG